MASTDENWLRQEFARANERSTRLPNFARPTAVRSTPMRSSSPSSSQAPRDPRHR